MKFKTTPYHFDLIKDYERLTATKTLFAELKKGEESAAKNGWLDPSDVRKMAGL